MPIEAKSVEEAKKISANFMNLFKTQYRLDRLEDGKDPVNVYGAGCGYDSLNPPLV